MARILAFTMLSPAKVYPFVPILSELANRGHSACFAIVDGDEARTPSQLGGIPIIAATTNAQMDERLSSLDPTALMTDDDHILAFAALGERMASALERVIAQYAPDLVLIDPMLWGGMIAAEASGLPWASLSHNPLTIQALGLDVRGPGLRPARGPLSRFWHRLVELQQRHQDDARFLPTLNAVRSRRNLAPLQRWRELYLCPPLTIAATLAPFEYPRVDWPASVHFVGPISWEPSSTVTVDIASPEDGRPLILVTGSSIPEHGAARYWVDIVLKALATEPVRVIAVVPTGELPRSVPENAQVARFVPHTRILPRVSCVVCHGGAGIVLKSLAAGVPVVAIPFAYDRFEVARRVDVAQAGVMLLGKRLSPRRLRRAVRRAMSRRDGALRVAEAFRKAGGAPMAADAVERLLKAHAMLNRGEVRHAPRAQRESFSAHQGIVS